ncbi:MAG: response regulator [Bacteroidales bacterium]|nr:response regulator [Bacteroidales bacterium]
MKIRPKILIVDDKKENLISLEKLLKHFDVDFIRALSGNEALSLTLKHEFALGIFDVQMPGMDGYETVEFIYEDPDINNFPIVFVSAIFKDEFHIIKGIQKGAVDFISKPIVPEILQGKVKVFLNLYLQKKELEKSNIELKKAREIAEKESYAKSIFLATMSHEIRTPMNGIIGVADMLTNTEMTKSQKELLEIIIVSGSNLMTIINDILDFSKIEAGQIKLENIDFSIHDIIKEIIKLLALKAKDQNTKLSSDIHPEIPDYIKGDPLRLKQTIINLVNNAIKFTKNGTVKIIAEVINIVGENFIIKFSIKDTGIGISKEGAKTIFKSYSQVSSSTSRKYGGTGLGLAISKNLSELMGGKIGVESEETIGSTFWFTTKLEKSTKIKKVEEKHETSEKATKQPQKKLSVLLAEDNLINQKVASANLKRLGHEMDLAENGSIAVEKFKNNKYDVILMDIQMPEMDGITATKKIREIEKTNNSPEIKIIAITANAQKEDRDLCMTAGMNGFLTKPFVADELINALSIK